MEEKTAEEIAAIFAAAGDSVTLINTDTEKEANNDSTTDSEKVTWSIKQVFKWGDK